MVDKVVVTNETELAARYGPAGLASVQAALALLIAADARRGIATRVLAIDDPGQMGAVGGSPVSSGADEPGAKAAVDAASVAWNPDYILLLGGPDIIPHIHLSPIPGLNDGDPDIPSDLPYASPAAWSRTASKFLAVTRVVGRLGAPEGANSADLLVGLIETAAAHRPRAASRFSKWFGMSADVWKASTQQSLTNVFGRATGLRLSPYDQHRGIDPDLTRLAHFINCHGAPAIDEFYGQQGSSYPVAIKGPNLAPNVRGGTVVAAECCFGAQLYDYAALGVGRPICSVYLENGAAAFVGSTNTAYGPATGNGQADLLTQGFLKYALAGASTGRALLQARHDFIRTQVMSSPSNLKTIAQFLLLGDPSLQPCQTDSAAPGAPAPAPDPVAQRKSRRFGLHEEGLAVQAMATWPGQPTAPPAEVLAELQQLQQAHGMADRTLHVLEADGGSHYLATTRDLGQQRLVAIAVHSDTSPVEGPPRSFTRVRVFTGHILDARVVRAETIESR
ncbi:MAG: C25 family cysteine peptidase [Phenylobacterium sp.]